MLQFLGRLLAADRHHPPQVRYLSKAENEPVWRDGVRVGRTTSGMFGHTVGGPLAMGYVASPADRIEREWIVSGNYEIEVAGIRIPAEASIAPFYDPRSARVKGGPGPVPGAPAQSRRTPAPDAQSAGPSGT